MMIICREAEREKEEGRKEKNVPLKHWLMILQPMSTTMPKFGNGRSTQYNQKLYLFLTALLVLF